MIFELKCSWTLEVMSNCFVLWQEFGNREYVHADIKIRLPVIDKLKKWNKLNSDIHYDMKFVRLILVDIFTTDVLAKSTLANLDREKIRFIRGLY